MNKKNWGRFLALAVSFLALSVPAQAATTTTPVTGSLSRTINTCLQGLTPAVSDAEDCGYGLGANNLGANSGEIVGPLTQGFYYSSTNAPFVWANALGVAGAGTTGYVPVIGDGKIEPVMSGSVTVDDVGTPADASDDLIGFTLTSTDPLGDKIVRHLGASVVERYTSMTQVLAPHTVNSATPNASGGFDYVIGSLGFPGRIQLLDADTISFPGDPSDGTVNPADPIDASACNGSLFGDAECSPSFTAGTIDTHKWNPVAGATWEAHQAAAGLGSLESNIGAITTGTLVGVECVDASDGPGGADVDQPGSPVAASDCDDSKVAYSAALIGDCVDFGNGDGSPSATTGCVQIDQDVGYDNLLLRVSTDGSGNVVSVAGFDVQETVVFGTTNECGQMTAEDDGVGPGGSGSGVVALFCNTWESGYFSLTASSTTPDAVDDTASTAPDTATDIDVLANDVNFNDPVTVTITVPPNQLGAAVVNGSPGPQATVDITYTPAVGFTGDETFSYQITDGTNTDTATVTVTVGVDTTPNQFTFTDQTGVAVSTVITSNTVTVAGINTAAAISVTGGEYSVNGGAFTTVAGTVNNGDTVAVRHTSSAALGTAVDTVLTIDVVSDTFTSTTAAADTTPNAFSFADQSAVAVSTAITSAAVTISGINSPAAISIGAGSAADSAYSVGCTGTFTTAAGTINNGETVCVRHTTSATGGATTDTVLTIGGVSDTFRTTNSGSSGGGVVDLNSRAAAARWSLWSLSLLAGLSLLRWRRRIARQTPRHR